jgi:hypothetical protein
MAIGFLNTLLPTIEMIGQKKAQLSNASQIMAKHMVVMAAYWLCTSKLNLPKQQSSTSANTSTGKVN